MSLKILNITRSFFVFDMIEYINAIFKVRTLRGLGAIQPGVNRCKLITRRDFEALYQDCTTSR